MGNGTCNTSTRCTEEAVVRDDDDDVRAMWSALCGDGTKERQTEKKETGTMFLLFCYACQKEDPDCGC